MKLRKLSTVSLALLFSFGMLNSSCDKVKDLVSVNIPLQTVEYEFEIPPLEEGEVTLGDFNIRFDMDSAIKANAPQFSTENIRKVRVTSVNVSTSNSTTTDHLGVFSTATARANSNVNTDITTIASLSNNPDTKVQSVDFTVDKDKELKSYFVKATSFSYVIAGVARRATTTTLNATVKVKFDIEVGP
ncbi:hypothetical protein [Pseudobacter ginsenosidimutans]|nr:hypothetical protein [Pseudobacter ginsenosidimutans]QEC44370.1 hypothetical protein FSB84_22830 [Pseudobacter ginsenosidimutans]